MRFIATATESWDGDDVSFGRDETCVSGVRQQAAAYQQLSLPGSSLLPPDTPWLALTGTSRAGAWLSPFMRGRAHANQTLLWHFLVASTSHSASASSHHQLLLLLMETRSNLF